MSALTDEMINGYEDHDEGGQVETEHLAELEHLAARISKHPFHSVQPEINYYFTLQLHEWNACGHKVI